MWKWLTLALALIVAWMVATPAVTVYQMRSAAAEHDGEALATYIDFPAVRDDLKDQLNARIARQAADETGDEWLGSVGGMLAGFFVSKAVDALVTPAAVIQLMRGDLPSLQAPKREDAPPPDEPGRGEPFGKARYRYEAWDKFAVIVPASNGGELRFILRRHGLGWKLTAIKLPA